VAAYLEYELILRSRGYSEKEIRNDLNNFRDMPNLDEAPLTLDILIKASELREKYNLSFFDSLHAATALPSDKVIISMDPDYGRIRELRTISLIDADVIF